MSTDAVIEMRLVITTDAFEQVLRFYRDHLGLGQETLFTSPDGSVALLAAGRATLEISDRSNAEFIDRIEVGRPVSGPIRLAFRVANVVEATRRLEAAGAEVLGSPRRTPFGSINSRLAAPELQLTLFQQTGEESWTTSVPSDHS